MRDERKGLGAVYLCSYFLQQTLFLMLAKQNKRRLVIPNELYSNAASNKKRHSPKG